MGFFFLAQGQENNFAMLARELNAMYVAGVLER